jgi:hypothetical protein
MHHHFRPLRVRLWSSAPGPELRRVQRDRVGLHRSLGLVIPGHHEVVGLQCPLPTELRCRRGRDAWKPSDRDDDATASRTGRGHNRAWLQTARWIDTLLQGPARSARSRRQLARPSTRRVVGERLGLRRRRTTGCESNDHDQKASSARCVTSIPHRASVRARALAGAHICRSARLERRRELARHRANKPLLDERLNPRAIVVVAETESKQPRLVCDPLVDMDRSEFGINFHTDIVE